ncbi:MAG: acyl-CoA dehydrogenase, partial [Gemmatimonadetes bacterium]|nr:acyl-CoA dehydrogenase [Gemmatimonadota bacterium]
TPHVEAWDAAAALPASLFENLSELGFMGMLVPEAYGGLDLDVTSYLVVVEELARADAASALTVSIQNGPVASTLLKHGTEAQREAWLPGLAAGEHIGAFALSEEGAGSDPAGVATTATRDGDGWVLNGAKKWVTNGARAGLLLVFARTGDRGELGCFLVPGGHPGLEVQGRTTTMGLRASETAEVRLNEVRLPLDALVGAAGNGLGIALDALTLGRAGIAAQAVGIAEASLEHAVRYSREREQFGRPLAAFGAIQAKLAEMAARTAVARAAVREVGARLQRVRAGEADDGVGENSLVARVAGAKLVASETAMFASDEAVQIFGGYGYMRDYPVEKLMRDAKGTEIYEGTSEILRFVIAREIMRAAEG